MVVELETKQFFDTQGKRKEQRSEEMHEKYFADLYRLKNYLRVLKETKAFRPKPNDADDRKLYNEIQGIVESIDEQILSTDHLIRLLEKLTRYDFTKMSVDEVNRMKLNIQTDRLNRLINNGAVMTEEEKQLIILFINS